MRTDISRSLPWIAAALFLLPAPSPAQDSADVVRRFDALEKQINRGNSLPVADPDKATAYDLLERQGFLYLASRVGAAETKAQSLLDSLPGLANTLNTEADSLAKAAAKKSSQKGEGVGGSPGVGWYCQRAREIMPQLAQVAAQVKQHGTWYAQKIGEVPLGQGSESTRQLAQLAANFNSQVQQTLAAPQTRAMIKDLKTVAEGLAPGSALEATNQAGASAETAAQKLRSSASSLQDVGTSLIPWLRHYADARREVGQEIAALKPLVKDPGRAQKLADLETAVRNSRKSPRSADEWQQMIRKAVDDGYSTADRKLDEIRKLRDPAASQLSACDPKDLAMKDLPKTFARARFDAHETITDAQKQVETAYNARAALIEREDRELDKAIREFAKIENNAALKAKEVYAQLQTIDRRSQEWREKEQQYDRLEASRKKARSAIEQIREQRNEYAKEQKETKQALSEVWRSLAALMSGGPAGGK